MNAPSSPGDFSDANRQGTWTIHFLNNCQNFDHSTIYGGSAFFDLWTEEKDDKVGKELQPGDNCLVASHRSVHKAHKANVVLANYQFTGRRRIQSAEAPGGAIWVLDGTFDRREVLPKVEAAQHSLYSRFFNKRGQFKQVSLLRGT